MQCDAKIFKFLLDYCIEISKAGYIDIAKSPSLRLTPRNLFPILVSSDFLQIDSLMKDCLVYWTRNFNTVMKDDKLPVNQLDSNMLRKLTEAIPYVILLQFVIKKHGADQPPVYNKDMLEQMFMHYVLKMLDEESFCTCQFCSEIYPLAHAHLLKCEAAASHHFVDNT